MSRQAILSAIRALSLSQGFYGSLYNTLTSGSDEAEQYLSDLEAQDFGSVVDMVMYIEC